MLELSRREEIGVTEEMIITFGNLIFDLSHNHQRRLGDPIRELNFEEIERQRPALGLTDDEIAERIGLKAEQVLYIRNIVEQRNFRSKNYHRLNKLGGGRRFRAERIAEQEKVIKYTDSALMLRQTMRFSPESVEAFVKNGWWNGDTLTTLLEYWAQEKPEKPAIISEDRVIKYSDLLTEVESLAGGLWKLGIGPGDVVAIQLPNSPEYLICILSIARIGAVISTLYISHRKKEMQTLLGHSDARALICLDEFADFQPAAVGLSLVDELTNLCHVISIDGRTDGVVPLTELFTGKGVLPEENDIRPAAADPFLLLYTSGTTDSPKGVPHSYQTVLGNARLSAPQHGITGDDILLSAAPYGHLFALYSFHLCFCVGATNLLLPIFSPPALAEIINKHKPTVLFAAPAHVAACIDGNLFERISLESLRLAILSGSAVSSKLVFAFDAVLSSGRVTQLWGMTETQAGLYTLPTDGLEIVASSSGRPSPGTAIRIVNDGGRILGHEEEGALEVSGPLMFPQYLNNWSENRSAFTNDGWFRTGDIAKKDNAGNVTITGRIKDVINRGGVKYNPRDVEELLLGHPSIIQAAIVAIPDSILGERACCFLVTIRGEKIKLKEVCEFLGSHNISKIKWPEKLRIIDEMPMTPTRKIIKKRLLAYLNQ